MAIPKGQAKTEMLVAMTSCENVGVDLLRHLGTIVEPDVGSR